MDLSKGLTMNQLTEKPFVSGMEAGFMMVAVEEREHASNLVDWLCRVFI